MDNLEELLKKFELSPTKDFHIFGGECIVAASRIEANYRKSPYDHRIFLPPLNPNFQASAALVTDQYRVGYACFKREVAKVLQPKTILEIGMGVGVSAFAFLDGCPEATYIGIDDDSDFEKQLFQVRPSYYVIDHIVSNGHNGYVMNENSQKLLEFPQCDLVHIDGDHARASVRHDFVLSWNSKAKWILCDDARDSEVAGGIFDALHLDLNRGSVDWAYFPDTWTGSILVRTNHRRSE